MLSGADIIERTRKAGIEAQRLYPGDEGETWRAIKGYEQLVELIKFGYSRKIALELLDPRKSGSTGSPVFGISERHIRRVERIAKLGKLEILIRFASFVSLETMEHMALHPSTETIEAAWVLANPAQQEEFLRRRVKK